MRIRLAIALLLIAAAIGRPLHPGAQGAADRTLVAVLRADGFVTPVAEFRSGAWTNEDAQPWGEGSVRVDPPPPAWFVQRGAPPTIWRHPAPTAMMTIRTLRAMVIDNHCQKNWALATDFPATPLGRNQHHTNVGLAASGSVQIDGFDSVENNSDTARRLLSFLTPVLDRAEDDEIRRLNARWPTGLPDAATRRAQPVTVETLARARSLLDGRVVYHLRLVRTILPAALPRFFDTASALNAWVAVDPRLPPAAADALSVRSFDHAIDDAARKGTTLVTPLGAVTIGGRTFVVITEHGYEDERYVILEAGGSALRRLLVTEGGGC